MLQRRPVHDTENNDATVLELVDEDDNGSKAGPTGYQTRRSDEA